MFGDDPIVVDPVRCEVVEVLNGIDDVTVSVLVRSGWNARAGNCARQCLTPTISAHILYKPSLTVDTNIKYVHQSSNFKF